MVPMDSGRTVFVSGGAGGLGAATVAAFVADGWRVVAPVRPGRPALGPASSEGSGAGDGSAGVVSLEADLSDEREVTAAMSVAAGDPAAPLRAVINLAGAYAGGGLIAETAVADFE